MSKLFLITPVLFSFILLSCSTPTKKGKEQVVKKDDSTIVILDTLTPTIGSPIVEEELFRINFPEPPEKDVDTTDQAVQYIVSQQGDSVRYMLYYRDYEPGKIQKYGEKKFLENQEKQVIDTHKFTEKQIIENKDITLGSYKGISLKAGASGNFYLVYRIYLVENRAYQMSISSVKGYPSEKDIKLFFESFQLKSPPKKTVKS
ncbi:hypothetical protein AD998_13770 [bacterium 336/3]|nr:hypothetical protein AD998_13770 [bacterium 336/3]